jgi:hypothetical protein
MLSLSSKTVHLAIPAASGRGIRHSVILVTGKAPVVIGGAYLYDAVKQLVDTALAN